MEVNHWMLVEDPAVQSETSELKEDSPFLASVPRPTGAFPSDEVHNRFGNDLTVDVDQDRGKMKVRVFCE